MKIKIVILSFLLFSNIIFGRESLTSFEIIEQDILNNRQLNVSQVLNTLEHSKFIYPHRVNYLYGVIYYFGDYGLNKDNEKAYRYLKISADSGDEAAAYLLGTLLVDDGPLKDIENGIKYLRSASNQGNVDAILNLYEMYRIGKYNDRDNILELLSYAAKNGSEESAIQYAETLFNISLVEQSKKKAQSVALYLLDYSFKSLKGEQFYLLSGIYGLSNSPMHNESKRDYYLNLAAKEGHKFSIKLLSDIELIRKSRK
ncbi:tetratricopeptide repeat protein [Pseudoalteromonas fuliginea]|uniref:tetratricopeptide repeat protein n=1 Tax=Pseudoalteromonas fuliginea TaxID=1872678 RepID=UPI0031827EA1